MTAHAAGLMRSKILLRRLLILPRNSRSSCCCGPGWSSHVFLPLFMNRDSPRTTQMVAVVRAVERSKSDRLLGHDGQRRLEKPHLVLISRDHSLHAASRSVRTAVVMQRCRHWVCSPGADRNLHTSSSNRQDPRQEGPTVQSMRLTWAAVQSSARIGKKASSRPSQLPRRQWEKTDERG